MHRDAGVLPHRVEHVGDLERDAFQRGAGEVAGGGAAREAGDRAARVLVPVRSAQPRKRRHEVDAAGVRHARGQRLHVRGRLDEAQPVAQPLHDCAADEDAPLQRVIRLRACLPRDRREQLVPRGHRLRARCSSA